MSLSDRQLHAALELATVLEHLDFWWQLDVDQDFELDLLPPLRTMLPLDRWPALWHLDLTGLLVAHDGLVSLLRDLAPTIRMVELNKLRFLYEHKEGGAGQG